MSIEAVALVLNHSKASGTAKLVLIGIANHDGDGGSWPSIATLARYANTTERSVQRAIAQLVLLGEVVVHENAGGTSETRGGYRPNRYDIHIQPVDKPVGNPDRGVTETSPLTDRGVTPVTPRGDASVARGVTPVSPEPSLNHPEPPATGRPDPAAAVEQLRAAIRQRPNLRNVTFTRLDADQTQQIADLVELHGVQRLVDAVATRTNPPTSVKAFIDDWADLEPVPPAQPRCPICSRTVIDCAIANTRLTPEDRCPGRKTA